MKVDFQKDLQNSRIPPPHPLQYMIDSTSTSTSAKMVKISVESFSEEELRKRFNALGRKGDWDKECESCKNPQLLHKANCTRKVEVGEAEFSELWKVWSAFRVKMEPIRKWYEDEMEKKQNSSDILIGMQRMTDAITKGNKEMCNMFKDRPNKLVKAAKVPSWSKDMKLDAYVKALEVWMEMNKDVGEAVRFQDVIESLKMNKEIEGLAKYVGEHVITRLDTIEKQKVKKIIELLNIKYGRTRIEI